MTSSNAERLQRDLERALAVLRAGDEIEAARIAADALNAYGWCSESRNRADVVGRARTAREATA
jgi:hypothetical protein